MLFPALALALRFTESDQDALRWRPPTLTRHEVATCTTLLVMPVTVYVGAMLSPLAFYLRYVQPVVLGFAIVVPLFAFRVAGGSKQFRNLIAILMVLCLAPWALLQTLKLFLLPTAGTEVQARTEIPETPNLKLVVAFDSDFLALYHYVPKNLRERLYFLSDTAAAVRYQGSDTGMRSLQLLQTARDVHVVEYRKFTTENREFLVERSHPQTWIIQKLLEAGAAVHLIRLHKDLGFFVEDRLLFHVTMPEPH